MTTKSEIEERFQNLIERELGNEVGLQDLESIQFVALILKVEEEFDIEIDADDMDVDLIGNENGIIDYIYNKVNE